MPVTVQQHNSRCFQYKLVGVSVVLAWTAKNDLKTQPVDVNFFFENGETKKASVWTGPKVDIFSRALFSWSRNINTLLIKRYKKKIPRMQTCKVYITKSNAVEAC